MTSCQVPVANESMLIPLSAHASSLYCTDGVWQAISTKGTGAVNTE